MAGGMDAVEAAALLARAGAEMAAGPSKGALRTRKWRHKTSQNVTGDAPNETVTQRHEPSQSVTCDAQQQTPLTLTSYPSDNQNKKKEEKKVRAPRRAPASPLPADWQPTQSHFDAAEKLKIPIAAVLSKAEDMRIWAKSSGAIKADWDATFHGFLRRDAEKLSGNANGKRTVQQAASDLHDRMRLFDEPPPGDLRDGAGEIDVRLLPAR